MPLDFSSQAQPLDFSSQAEPLDFSAGAVAVADAPGRAARKASLQGQQAAARSELIPRLAGLMPAPDGPERPAGIYRDMEQGFAPTMPTALPRAPRITAQDAARAFDVLGAAAEFARQGAFNPNASTELDERMARDVTPGIPSKIAAGVQQTAAGLADPEAVAFMAATAGLGALPVAAQRAASLGFAGWMAANAGTQAAELEQAVKDDDVEAAARATAGLGLDSLFAGLSAKHGLQGIAARNPRLAGWLSKRLVQEVPPEQVRGVLDRAAAGTATAGELEVAGLLRSAGIADAAGAGGVTLRGQVPRVGPAFQDWLGVPNGRGSVEVRDGRPVNPVDRLLLEDAAQSPRPRTSDPIIPPSPPETAPPEVIPPSTAAPAPAGLPTIRGEAAMETRPSAGWTPDGRREPAVSPDLAETIQALREGYVPEVEKGEAPAKEPWQMTREEYISLRLSEPDYPRNVTVRTQKGDVETTYEAALKNRLITKKQFEKERYSGLSRKQSVRSDAMALWHSSVYKAIQSGLPVPPETLSATTFRLKGELISGAVLAETIQALREGYVPEVEKAVDGPEMRVESPKGGPNVRSYRSTTHSDVPDSHVSIAEERWDTAKLGVRIRWLKEAGYVTNAGKLKVAAEAVAELPWREMTDSQRTILTRPIRKDYPSRFESTPLPPAEVLADYPDLAETIQALREGYVPEVEKVEAVVESPKGDPMLSDFENARRAGMPTPRTDAAEKRLRSLRPPRTNQEAEGMVNALESARHADTQLHQLSERVKAMPDEQLAEFAQATARDAKLASMKSVREHNEQASETARKEIKRRAATPPPSPAPAETIQALREGYVPKVEKGEAPAKEPWQMTRFDYADSAKPHVMPANFEAMDALAKKSNRSPYNPDALTDAAIQELKKAGLVSGIKNFKLTEDGRNRLADLRRDARENDLAAGDASDLHIERVEKALRDGLPVPAEVLADYPDLKPTTTPTPPAEVRPAESGEQPKPPAQAAPAMQEGMDNLRFTSDPVKTAKAGGADAKDAKAKLIAELEKAVEQSPALTEAQTEAVKEMRQALDASSKARSERMAAAAIEMEKSGLRKVTVEIPGDGTFTVWNTKENLGELLRKAKKLETAIKPPKGYSETGVSKEDREWTAQMQAAQGKPFVDWWVPVNEYAPDAPNNKNVVKTVSARTAFEAEQEAASLPGVVAVWGGVARPAPPSPTGAGGGSGNASVGDFRAPVPAQAASKPQAAADAGFAESGLFVDGVEVRLGGSEAVNPVLLPEMYRLFHELTGGESPFLRRYRKANGMFYGEGAGRIGLHPDLFKFPHQVAYTFAHELGHLVDYLPDRALDRGNVLGRIGALRGWLTTTFPLHPKTSLDEVLKPNDRAKLRREAEKAIGPKPADKTDAAAWQEQISERYGEMVEQEIEARGLISLKQVRDELLAVSQWWRPYDPATATESYRAYRESGVELYADALSVLFNSPGHLEQKAPTFYKAFWNWLDAKPEFKAALARVQELLGKGDAEVLRARVADDRADFAKGREAFEAAHAEQERLWSDPKEVLRRLERQLLDKGAELERIAKAERGGGVLPVGPDLREKWEQMNMADNLIYQFSARLVRDVVKPLQDAGLDANTDLGIYLKHARIQGNKSAREELDVLKARLGRPVYLLAEKFADLMEELERKGLAENLMIDKVILPAESAGIEFEDITELARLRIEQGTRADLANPRMVQAKESERTLNQYLSDLGPAKSAVLKQAVQAFHDEVFKLVEHGHRAGIFSDRQLALAAVNKDTYAAFRPLEYVDTYVQPTMRKAKGSAKPIENPFVTTMLKMQSLADLIMRQKSLNTTRDTMQRLDPEAFKLAETFWTPNGKQARSAPRDRVRLVVREQGKPVAYDVDPAIAEAYQKLSPYEQNVAARWVNWFFHQSLYKGYVSWSLPFNLWNNPWRDVSRTQLNMAAVFGKRAPSVAELARAYKDAWDSAKKYTQGELTPLSQEALDFYAIYAPTDAFYSQFPEDNASHAIMVKLGLAPEPPNRLRTLAGKIPVVKQAVAFGDWIQAEGQKREAVGKLGPWLALQRAGVNPEQAATFVRNYVGTPNIKSAGSQSYIPNAIFPFYRIYSQAARTWVRLARNPQTRGGYFYQWAITRGTMRALLSLAGLGAFGVAAKQWIDGVPEYERTRGIPLPLPPGSQPGGDYGSKSVFLRIPDDEFSALLGYSLDNAIRAAAGQKEPGKAASDAAKQWLTSAPGLNTYADLASQWMAYAGGGEPRDNFRGRPVLSEAERKAGGTAALGKMAQFTADKSGIPFMRQNPTEPTSTPEAVLRFVPLLKDIVKVTDAGFREKDQAQRDAVEQVKYAIRMDYGDNTKSLLHRHAQLDRAGTTRTLPQEADYRYLQAWHSTYNRFDAAVVDAQQRGEKGAAKERIAALERLSASTKTALDTGHAARDAAATGGRNLPWSPRLTNAVPVRK